MLVESTPNFDNAVLQSKHYLNSPKSILNDYLDSLYRLIYARGEQERAITLAYSTLKKYGVPKPMESAKNFMLKRENISMKQFRKLNKNWNLKVLPTHIQYQHDRINRYIERGTKETWFLGHLIDTFVPDYPFKDINY